jgi:hypothetical protein
MMIVNTSKTQWPTDYTNVEQANLWLHLCNTQRLSINSQQALTQLVDQDRPAD